METWLNVRFLSRLSFISFKRPGLFVFEVQDQTIGAEQQRRPWLGILP